MAEISLNQANSPSLCGLCSKCSSMAMYIILSSQRNGRPFDNLTILNYRRSSAIIVRANVKSATFQTEKNGIER